MTSPAPIRFGMAARLRPEKRAEYLEDAKTFFIDN